LENKVKEARFKLGSFIKKRFASKSQVEELVNDID